MFICAVLAVFIAGNMPTHAFADATDCPKGMSELDCDAINGPWPAWIPDSGGACEDSGGTLVGGQRAEQIWNFFLSRGLKPVAVAGIMGNFAQEDGLFDPALKQGYSKAAIPDGGDGATGYGIAQWTSQGRQAGLFKEMRQAGLEKYYGAGWGHPEIDKEMPQKDIDALLLIELNYAWSGDSTKVQDIAKQLNAAKSIRGDSGSTILFHRLFEASADNASQIQERVDSAAMYLKKYRGTSGSVIGSTGCAGGLGGVSTMEDAVPWADQFIKDARGRGAQSRKLNQKHTGNLWSLYVTSNDESHLCWTNDCEQCTAASAWFIAKMTKYPADISYTTGNGWQVVYSLKARGIPTGSKPQPFSVFSWGSGVGHTGVVLGVLENGQVITLENNWPNGTLVVRKYDIKKDYPDVRFAYFADKMKVDVNNDAGTSE